MAIHYSNPQQQLKNDCDELASGVAAAMAALMGDHCQCQLKCLVYLHLFRHVYE